PAGDPEAPVFGNFQYEIYARGLAGETPTLPVSAAARQEGAREKLSPEAYGYVAGGAGAERTMQANLEAFERWKIVPRMLRDVSARELSGSHRPAPHDVSARDLSGSLLGTQMSAPLMLAPVGVQSIVHPQAELAAARGAASQGVPFILSTGAAHSI